MFVLIIRKKNRKNNAVLILQVSIEMTTHVFIKKYIENDSGLFHIDMHLKIKYEEIKTIKKR